MSARIHLFIILIAVSSLAHSELYKWVDKNGGVHFSDQPVDNQSTDKINVEIKKTPYKKQIKSHKNYDDTLVGYMDELVEKAEEMQKEAESCYYFAMQDKFDISCKNYTTLLQRDFKPLIQDIKNYILEHPEADTTYVKNKLNTIEDIGRESDDKFDRAISHLKNLYDR